MLEKIKEVLQEKYVPFNLLEALKTAKTDDEMLTIAHQLRAQMEAVEMVNFSLLKVLKDEEKKESDK